ncbi:MAG: DUF4234 domain-containing protein [Planctomycetes bacterium]|nr:DUF4234 domain-containing protein [Planctomycetota bacterium]
MISCPYCARTVPDGTRVCKECGAALVRRCPACAEEIPVLAHRCRYCGAEAVEPRSTAQAFPVGGGPLGENRNILATLLLTLVTCGIYGLVVQYLIGEELNAHRRKEELSPGLDVLLYVLTCGVWGIYVHYRYAQALKESCESERLPVQDVTTVCLILQVCSLFMPGFLGLVSLLILQNEMNMHWERHSG